MEFQFRLSTCDDPSLAEDLAGMINHVMEDVSRRKMPWLWRITDWLNARKNRGPERYVRHYRVYGVLLLLLGVIALVPGLTNPGGLTSLLIAGVLAAGSGLFFLFLPKKRIMSAASKPSEKPEIQISPKMLRTAGDMLEKYRPLAGHTEVLFKENQVEVRAVETEDTEETAKTVLTLPYGEVEGFYNSEGLWLLTYRGKALPLQKEDLVSGDEDAFPLFVLKKINKQEEKP